MLKKEWRSINKVSVGTLISIDIVTNIIFCMNIDILLSNQKFYTQKHISNMYGTVW
jgi:hypothetical protein